VSISDVQAVIDSAKSRGTESLERLIRERLREATDTEVRDATDLALEIIESVPLFLARAGQEAEQRQLTSVVTPLMNHAEGYFVQPVDLIPEMTQGLAGLLDDSYLVLRILHNLDRGPDRFLDWDLGHPLDFLRRLVGEEVARKLDVRSLDAMQEIVYDIDPFRDEASYQA
jgi:uncharacterized membrane protein YkvA (DUF1232 family)